jgi:hypothetical protein
MVLFNDVMVLFNDVIEVFDLTDLDACSMLRTVAFDRRRIGAALIDRDLLRRSIPPDRLAQGPQCSFAIPLATNAEGIGLARSALSGSCPADRRIPGDPAMRRRITRGKAVLSLDIDTPVVRFACGLNLAGSLPILIGMAVRATVLLPQEVSAFANALLKFLFCIAHCDLLSRSPRP